LIESEYFGILEQIRVLGPRLRVLQELYTSRNTILEYFIPVQRVSSLAYEVNLAVTHRTGDRKVLSSMLTYGCLSFRVRICAKKVSFTLFPCPFFVLAIALFTYYTSVPTKTESRTEDK